MKTRSLSEVFKSIAGTVFLLASTFFVCSTIFSMRIVLADPVPQFQNNNMFNQYSSRPSPRYSNVSGRVSRTGNLVVESPRYSENQNLNIPSRASTSVARNVVSRTPQNRQTQNDSVVNTSRSVRARTGVARVSVAGDAVRGSRGYVSSNVSNASGNYSNSGLLNKFYTGNYSNIIDPNTGLISADAYSNCMESYYACMDEICTARNSSQRRCGCAGRARVFMDAEEKLKSANAELIKVAGELALLIATKGKDISSAFKLTDAEKVLNCVSWKESSKNDPDWSGESAKKWCLEHGEFESARSTDNKCPMPKYCKSGGTDGNNFDFNIDNLNGSGSDILASLKSWADAKDKTLTLTKSNEDNALRSMTESVNKFHSITNGGDKSGLNSNGTIKDSLAETWGYELFEYAHNNVCNRVLDSCFNGIYESCGTPANGNKCSNGASYCPYNYNTTIAVKNTGKYELNFASPNTKNSSSGGASCFGYTGSSGDPYASLRTPVADARRSILQKYALDANADCDAYGEKIAKTAQNIGYQKVAAQQALQKKRMEFAKAESDQKVSSFMKAKQNFIKCIDEVNSCLININKGDKKDWAVGRKKTYCSTLSVAPSCYETMICDEIAQSEVINKSENCKIENNKVTGKCKNTVLLSDFLFKSKKIDTNDGIENHLKDCINGYLPENHTIWTGK